MLDDQTPLRLKSKGVRMYNLKDFEKYTGQPLYGKAVICWSKKLGYFFLDKEQALEEYKVVGVEK